jgi:HK97 family phage portal protein
VSLLRELRSIRNVSVENPAVPLTSSTLLDMLGGAKVAAGVSVNEASAMGMPAVYRAITLIAGTAASLPLHAYKRTGDTRTPLSSGVAVELLDAPHPDLTPFEFWELLYGHAVGWGNAYARKLRNQAGQVRELWPLHPSRVKPGRASDGTKVYVVDGDIDGPLTDREVMHIAGFGYDGVCGMSPIRAHRQGIGLALAAEEYGARLFGSGSLASGILETEQRLTQDQADKLKSRWKARTGGLDKAHEVAVLDWGTKFHQLTIPPEDAQFIESRRFQIQEVARMFGVPPHMLMDTTTSTSWGTGIEQQTIGFVTFTLRPNWLTRFEQRISQVLWPEPVYAKYALEGLLRGDSVQRAAFYQQLWNIGVLSTNDIRALEDLPPVEGGDVRYRPLNMGVLGESDPEPDPEPAEATQDDLALAARADVRSPGDA